MEPDGAISPEERVFNEMSAVDQLKFERELANKREYTPEEAKQNIAETLLGLAYSTPGIANSMSIRDAFEAREAAAQTDDPEEKKRLNAQAVTSVLSAFLPFSLGSPSAGSASRFGVFAGPAARTADHAALAKAKDMAKTGASRDEIIDATGWFKDVDGKWRFEIDDSGMMALIRPAGDPDFRDITKIVKHPELFKAYPQLRDIDFIKDNYGTAGRGSFAGSFDSNIPPSIRVAPGDAKQNRSTMLHELQHAIQDIEGQAGGGSVFGLSKSPGDLILLPAEQRQVSKLTESIFELPFEDPARQTMMRKRQQIYDQAAHRQYRQLAGEVEARNVEARKDMRIDERRAKRPWETQDIPDNEQIVRFHGEGPQETFVPADEAKSKIARQLYEDLPRSFTRPDLANQETMRRTGVLFGSGGEPKQVVSDKAMRIVNALQGGETRPLSGIVEHPELFGRVEGLADTPVEVLPAIKAASGEGFHRPIARTTEGGTFQISENARPKWLKEQMAKLMQYEIGRRAGFAPAARHGIAANIDRIDQTIEAVSKAMESGATPRKTGMAYIDKLMKAKNRIAIAQEVSGTDPASSPWLREMGYQSPIPENEAARAISRALNSRMAGNVDAEIAMHGVHGTEAPYPYKGRSMSEMIALPPQIDDMEKLAEFLRDWRTYGQGAPQSVMRRMPEHLR